jgi:hypothetical protein
MGVRLTATTGSYSRTTRLPSYTAFTMAMWVFPSTVNTVFADVFARGSVNEFLVQLNPGTSKIEIYNGASNDCGFAALAANKWYHVAISVNGSSCTPYLNGRAGSAQTMPAAPGTDKIWFGNGSGEDLRGAMAEAKVWSAALSAAEIQNEMMYVGPCRLRDLNSYYPFDNLAGSKIDRGSFGLTLTIAGTPTAAEQPPVLRRFRGVGYPMLGMMSPPAGGGGSSVAYPQLERMTRGFERGLTTGGMH